MKTRILLLLCVACFIVSDVLAQPSLTVVDGGLNGSSNREWVVRVAPDASLFSSAAGGSLAVELGFDVTAGSLVSATANSVLWPRTNPGNDPFTNAITRGVAVDSAANTVFAALGSGLFPTDAAVDVITIETAGSATTTLTWGGHLLLAGSDNAFTGSRIAQNGVNYDNYMGTLTLGGGGLPCDLDADGDCDQADIDLLYANSPSQADITNWLLQASDPANPYKTDSGGTVSDVYVMGDVNLDGDVNSTDLGQLLNNFGSGAGPGWSGGDLNADNDVNSTDLGLLLNEFGSMSASVAVPEPSGLLSFLSGLGLFFMIASRRRNR